ncbi:MAG: flavodoxin [Candidatus Riflemargulisbacteria bacterium]
MSKTIIVYYSFEGSTKFIADYLAEKLGAEILSLKPEKEISTHGFMKYFFGGRQAVMKIKPPLIKYVFDVNKYDTIILGCPIWAGPIAPPLRTFLSENKIEGKKVAFFCTHKGGKGKVLEVAQKLLSNGNEYLGSMDINSPLTNNDFSFDLLNEWIESLS